MRKPVFANKGADQPAHPRSLISTFVVRCLDSIIFLVSVSEISRDEAHFVPDRLFCIHAICHHT